MKLFGKNEELGFYEEAFQWTEKKKKRELQQAKQNAEAEKQKAKQESENEMHYTPEEGSELETAVVDIYMSQVPTEVIAETTKNVVINLSNTTRLDTEEFENLCDNFVTAINKNLQDKSLTADKFRELLFPFVHQIRNSDNAVYNLAKTLENLNDDWKKNGEALQLAYRKKLDEKLLRQFQNRDNAITKLNELDISHMTDAEFQALGFNAEISKEDLDYMRNNPELYNLSSEADEKRIAEAERKLSSNNDEDLLKEVRKKLS